jgi:hypothetical protein
VLPVVTIMLCLAPFASRLADTQVQLEMYSAYSVWVFIAMTVWLLGTAIALFMLWRKKKMLPIIVLALSSLLATQIGLSGYNTVARERSGYLLAEAIKPLIKPDVPFYSVKCYEQTLPFYLKRTFTLVDYQDEMDFGIKQEPARWIASEDELARRWSTQAEAYAIVPTQDLHILQQQGMVMKEIYRDEQYVVVSKS